MTAPCWLAATHQCCSLIWFLFFLVFSFLPAVIFFKLVFFSSRLLTAVAVSQDRQEELRIWAAEGQSAESPLLISDLVSTVNHRRHLQGIIAQRSSKYSPSGVHGLHLAAFGALVEWKPPTSNLMLEWKKTHRHCFDCLGFSFLVPHVFFLTNLIYFLLLLFLNLFNQLINSPFQIVKCSNITIIVITSIIVFIFGIYFAYKIIVIVFHVHICHTQYFPSNKAWKTSIFSFFLYVHVQINKVSKSCSSPWLQSAVVLNNKTRPGHRGRHGLAAWQPSDPLSHSSLLYSPIFCLSFFLFFPAAADWSRSLGNKQEASQPISSRRHCHRHRRAASPPPTLQGRW